MKPTKKIFFLFLFLLLFNAIYNVSHLFLSHFNTKTPFIGKKVRFGPIVAWASFDALGPLRHKKFLQPPPHSIF